MLFIFITLQIFSSLFTESIISKYDICKSTLLELRLLKKHSNIQSTIDVYDLTYQTQSANKGVQQT